MCIAALATCFSSKRITFFFLVVFWQVQSVDWNWAYFICYTREGGDFLGLHLTQTHMEQFLHWLSRDAASLKKNSSISVDFQKSFLTFSGLKDESASWACVEVLLDIKMLSLYRTGMHNLFIRVGAFPSVLWHSFSNVVQYFVSWQTKKYIQME